MQPDKLHRMQDLVRGRANAFHVLTSSGEFTSAEILEYWPLVKATGDRDPLRGGTVQ